MNWNSPTHSWMINTIVIKSCRRIWRNYKCQCPSCCPTISHTRCIFTVIVSSARSCSNEKRMTVSGGIWWIKVISISLFKVQRFCLSSIKIVLTSTCCNFECGTIIRIYWFWCCSEPTWCLILTTQSVPCTIFDTSCHSNLVIIIT